MKGGVQGRVGWGGGGGGGGEEEGLSLRGKGPMGIRHWMVWTYGRPREGFLPAPFVLYYSVFTVGQTAIGELLIRERRNLVQCKEDVFRNQSWCWAEKCAQCAQTCCYIPCLTDFKIKRARTVTLHKHHTHKPLISCRSKFASTLTCKAQDVRNNASPCVGNEPNPVALDCNISEQRTPPPSPLTVIHERQVANNHH